MKPQTILGRYHKVILYVATLGLAAYGVMAMANPEILAAGFSRFTKQDWEQFQLHSHMVAAYVTLLWRLVGAFNLAVGLTLTLVVWRWLQPGHGWAWTTLMFGTLIAYLSPMILDLTAGSIEFFEVIEFLLFGLFVMTMLSTRKRYFARADTRGQRDSSFRGDPESTERNES